MNHSNEGIWEPPLAGGKPRRLTHFTALPPLAEPLRPAKMETL